MAYWEVVLNEEAQVDWLGLPCDVITYRRRFGGHHALIGCEQSVATTIRGVPGVQSVEPAPDGHYVDGSGDTYEVSGGGARCRFVGRARDPVTPADP